MIPLDKVKSRRAHFDNQNKYIYIGHYKAGFSSAVNIALKKRSIRPASKKYKDITYNEEEFNNIFKFTIIRNPYDRVLSAFFFLQKGNQGPKIPQGTDFKVWIKKTFKNTGTRFNMHFQKMYNRISYQDNIWVDYIAKLENINDDWNYIADKVDLIKPFPLMNYSKIKKHRFDYYDDECVEIVYNIYKEDIDKLSYSYEDK